MKIFLLVLLSCLTCSYAYANTLPGDVDDCMTNSLTIPLEGEVHFQRDDPVGTEKTLEESSSTQTLDCGILDNGSDRDLYYEFTAKSPYGASNISKVFKTGLPGVGVKYNLVVGGYSGFSYCQLENPSLDYIKTDNTPTNVKCHWIHGTQQSTVQVTIKIVAVKLEESITAGVLTGIPYVINTQYVLNNIMTPFDTSDINVVSSAQVFSDKCSFDKGTMVFAIGDIGANEFSNQTGFIPEIKSLQNLNLECDANANINVTLNGTQNPDASDSSILSLNNQGQAGVAEGIGVQLLYNDTPLEINKLLNLKRSTGGQENFAFTARYIQTKNQVQPGVANATATLNLTYQ